NARIIPFDGRPVGSSPARRRRARRLHRRRARRPDSRAGTCHGRARGGRSRPGGTGPRRRSARARDRGHHRPAKDRLLPRRRGRAGHRLRVLRLRLPLLRDVRAWHLSRAARGVRGDGQGALDVRALRDGDVPERGRIGASGGVRGRAGEVLGDARPALREAERVEGEPQPGAALQRLRPGAGAGYRALRLLLPGGPRRRPDGPEQPCGGRASGAGNALVLHQRPPGGGGAPGGAVPTGPHFAGRCAVSMRKWSRRLRPLVAVLAPLALLLGRPQGCAAAQRSHSELPTVLPLDYADRGPGIPVLPSGGRSIRISLEEHRLYVLDGERVVWSAKIGTGTGETLEGAGQRWDFSTP